MPDGARGRRALTATLVLAAGYMVAEIVGGILTNSLALLADAGHMFSDVLALSLSLFAIWIARRPATAQHTYGYYRAEIMAALINGASLVAISIVIFLEAFQRFWHPPQVQGGMMMGIAAGGLLVNLLGLWFLSAGRTDSINMRGAWLHVLTDMLGSVQAIGAGALIWAFGWNWIDPIASILIGMLVIYSSWALLKEATGVLMEWTPAHIDVDEVRAAIAEVSGVLKVGDLHVWTITSGLISLSAHVGVGNNPPQPTLLRDIREVVHQRFGIDHITVQLDPEDCDNCHLPV